MTIKFLESRDHIHVNDVGRNQLIQKKKLKWEGKLMVKHGHSIPIFFKKIIRIQISKAKIKWAQFGLLPDNVWQASSVWQLTIDWRSQSLLLPSVAKPRRSKTNQLLRWWVRRSQQHHGAGAFLFLSQKKSWQGKGRHRHEVCVLAAVHTLESHRGYRGCNCQTSQRPFFEKETTGAGVVSSYSDLAVAQSMRVEVDALG